MRSGRPVDDGVAVTFDVRLNPCIDLVDQGVMGDPSLFHLEDFGLPECGRGDGDKVGEMRVHDPDHLFGFGAGVKLLFFPDQEVTLGF